MPRPRFTLTSEQLEQLPKLAAYLTIEQLADVLEISTRTLRRRMKDDVRFNTKYRQGRAQAIMNVAESLLQQALKGNVVACIFYLKCQAGWREADPKSIPIEELENVSEKKLARERRRLGLVD
jgi:AraC-like DNA-binding protein